MTSANKANNENYRKLREEYDALYLQEKATFLVEAGFSMLRHGIEAIGSFFSEEIDKMYESAEKEAEQKKEEKKPRNTARKTRTTTKPRSTSRSQKKSN